MEYIAKLAYEPWMVDSRLVLRERMTGCLDCTAATEESTVKAPFIKLFTPRYVTPFVTPEREAVKVRNEVRVARLQFRQGKSDVDPRYKDNRAELETVTGSINVVKTNPDLTITGIYITGYASPEGSVAFNQKLSESRANALAEYARKDTHMDASLWHVAGMGEDWEGLRREVGEAPAVAGHRQGAEAYRRVRGRQGRLREAYPRVRITGCLYPPAERDVRPAAPQRIQDRVQRA